MYRVNSLEGYKYNSSHKQYEIMQQYTRSEKLIKNGYSETIMQGPPSYFLNPTLETNKDENTISFPIFPFCSHHEYFVHYTYDQQLVSIIRSKKKHIRLRKKEHRRYYNTHFCTLKKDSYLGIHNIVQFDTKLKVKGLQNQNLFKCIKCYSINDMV